jgi:predicted peptidase
MSRTYYTHTEITDYGPFTTKIILPLPEKVSASDVSADKFSVYVERKDKKGEILSLPKSWMALNDREPSKGYVSLRDAYPSDIYGNKAESGDFITLETKYGPSYTMTAGISAPNGLNEFIISDYRITQTGEIKSESGKLSGLVFDICSGNTTPLADEFRHGNSEFEGTKLTYGYFIPQLGNGKRPLIIWLHGAGEGGTDPKVAYAGNKVVNLASEKIQKMFGGAYVLVPQTPTFWMNDGSGQYGATGKSIYVKALKNLIDEFITLNDAGIDTGRVYIGGDSNGGFMTMRMIVDYPDFFAAAFPVCEALYDNVISDSDIENIKHLPIWFTHAKNDPVVKPDMTVVPTYERLIKAGGKNIHFTFWDHICDLHGLFRDSEGKPYEYIGHFAWIPMLNDDCKTDYNGKPVTIDGKEVTLLEWLSHQKK